MPTLAVKSPPLQRSLLSNWATMRNRWRLVLYLYEITLLSNGIFYGVGERFSFVPLRNYTTLKHSCGWLLRCRRFVPLRNYTTLKQALYHYSVERSFVPLRNYTTLKPARCTTRGSTCFVPLRNYTTLKPMMIYDEKGASFVPLRNYTTLKPQILLPYPCQHAEKAVTSRRKRI